jgi:3'(2'), 5'-bisphosphate nucleotidase
MPPTSPEDVLEPALDAVAQAGVVCRHVQRGLDRLRAMTKDDRSPVTVADYASQAIVAAILREALGELVLVGEESAAFLRQPEHAPHLAAVVGALRDSGVWTDATETEVLEAVDLGAGDPAAAPGGFWTLDPIDGTKGFLRGQQYCVSLALIQHGRPTLGVLGCPNLSPRPPAPEAGPDPYAAADTGSMYWAIAGEGAMMSFDAPAATIETNLERGDVPAGEPARLAESVESAHTNQDLAARIMSMAGPALPPVHIDSQCKYAVVARGDADVYLRLPSRRGYVERIWDHAAGALVAAEAGCTVTDALGRPLDFSRGRGLEANTGIVGAPPELHARIMRAMRELGV